MAAWTLLIIEIQEESKLCLNRNTEYWTIFEDKTCLTMYDRICATFSDQMWSAVWGFLAPADFPVSWFWHFWHIGFVFLMTKTTQCIGVQNRCIVVVETPLPGLRPTPLVWISPTAGGGWEEGVRRIMRACGWPRGSQQGPARWICLCG